MAKCFDVYIHTDQHDSIMFHPLMELLVTVYIYRVGKIAGLYEMLICFGRLCFLDNVIRWL